MQRVLSPLVALGLAIAPISASAADRAGTPVEESESLGGSPVLLIALVALVVGVLIIAVTDGEEPTSP